MKGQKLTIWEPLCNNKWDMYGILAGIFLLAGEVCWDDRGTNFVVEHSHNLDMHLG